ncbi:molybdopterin molybdotransferase MoeA [Streptomyces sp. SL13]|uniref:Molybdopterin molybdenumtransferase n=1 Tax=Streptantibioticus silvisoli TaxID=2705255 RepID=A0AA90K9M9_9ACTN|nr:gephyrin-like molybdotransferase Glp [Streptantibioticus silvisoli]MDI5971383.1 molybdopterin molybdotransferase MoeA [Streptantibioticus silvisoli]
MGETNGGHDEGRLWTVDEHLTDILRQLTPLEPIDVPLLDAQGCVLAEDVTVPVALPPFDNSSMDGYAVRVADLAGVRDGSPRVLDVIGDIAAGDATLPTVHPGQAARIMTGAPLPPGADAVVPVEWTDAGRGGGPATTMRAHSADPSGATGQVRVHRSATAGAHVRPRGSDVAAGELALGSGTLVGPPQISLLAAIGRARVRVRPRPRVVVISTGSELVPPGEPLTPGSIHDSNSFALTAAARDAGALAYRADTVTDDAEALRDAIEDHLGRADVLVTSGGVSVGAYDVVKEALSGGPFGGAGAFGAVGAFGAGVPFGAAGSSGTAGSGDGGGADGGAGSGDGKGGSGDRDRDRGGSGDSGGAAGAGGASSSGGGAAASGSGGSGVDFRRLAMQPGKPQGFGLLGPARVPLLALPGNPVSSYVSFELFVRPVVRTLMGMTPVHRPVVRARCVEAVTRSPRGRRQFLRARHHGDGTVTPVGGAGSHLVKALAHANALIVVPEETTDVAAGTDVDVVLLT